MSAEAPPKALTGAPMRSSDKVSGLMSTKGDDFTAAENLRSPFLHVLNLNQAGVEIDGRAAIWITRIDFNNRMLAELQVSRGVRFAQRGNCCNQGSLYRIGMRTPLH